MTSIDPELPQVPARLISDVRQLLASAISEEKAYNLPDLCSGLGLRHGETDEAFQSKFRYAERRLLGQGSGVVLAAARGYLADHDHYELSEAVAKIDELAVPQVTRLTRRRLMAVFEGIPFSTELDHLELLNRVWPLDRMPSGYEFYGSEERSLEDRLIQHSVHNDDMSSREILEAVGFLTCSNARLFRFLSEIVGPEAQTPSRQAALVKAIDNHLVHDGYRLTVTGRMSGSPIYSVKQILVGCPADPTISEALNRFDPDDISPRWQAAMDSREDSPGRAITLARTLLEDVCKWIITEAGESYRESDDLPTLYRQLAKLLRLAPDDHTEQIFKQLLGACQSVVESLGALRNKLGDAHSLGPLRAKPAPRHAALAVTLSGGMATFLVETWVARKKEREKL